MTRMCKLSTQNDRQVGEALYYSFECNGDIGHVEMKSDKSGTAQNPCQNKGIDLSFGAHALL
jgi:hypothetical protein